MTYFNITKTNGLRGKLVSNDTFTLAFCPGMRESTPATLRAFVSEKSLRRLAAMPGHEKAEKALAIRAQFSAHGANRRSVRLFRSDSSLIGDYDL